jgi:septal ring factor EnvC (AmiA/AmiB activator)
MIGRGVAVLGVVAGLALAAAAFAAPASDPITAEQHRLVLAKQQAASAAARADRLDQQAGLERDAAAKAGAKEAAVKARIDKAEADIAAAEARIALVQADLDAERARLAQHQEPIVRLLAALDSLARRPAVAAVAEPGSVDDLVHVRAVLATVTPAIQQRTAGIRDELDRTRALRASAALAVQSLADGRRALDAQQLALARLEMTHHQRSAALGRQALAASDAALAMGEAARDAVDRIGELGDQAGIRADLAALPEPMARPDDLGRRGDGLALAAWPSYDAPYRLPVAGRLVTGFGEVSVAGVRSRGLTLATASGAAVIAPAAGCVAYARRFGDFGTIVIIDHGDGWTTLITGLASADVARGQTVGQGAEIGRTGSGTPQVTIELRRRGRPVDMIPLLG